MYSERFEIDNLQLWGIPELVRIQTAQFHIEALSLAVNLIIIIYTTSKVPRSVILRFLSMKLQTFWREIGSVCKINQWDIFSI